MTPLKTFHTRQGERVIACHCGNTSAGKDPVTFLLIHKDCEKQINKLNK